MPSYCFNLINLKFKDWIHSREIDLSQSQQSVFFDFGSSVSKTSKDEQALQEEINALKEQTVSEMSLIDKLRADEKDTITVAAAMNTIAKGCSVCKEKFIKIWNDIEEEWSYKNATVVDRMLEIIVKTTQLTPENANMIRQQLAQLWTAAPSALPAASAPPAPSAPSASPAPSVPVLPGFPQPNMSQPGLPQVVPMVSTSVPPGMMIPPPIHHQQPTSSAASVIPTSQIPPFPGMPPHFAPHLPPLGSIPSPQTMVAPLPATSLPFVPGSMPPMPGMSPMPSLPSIPMSAAVASPTVAPAVASPIPPSRPAAIVPPAASDLIASLMQSGLLGPNGTLTSQLLQNTANLNRASPSPSPLMTAATAATAKPPLPPNTSITQVNQSEHDQGVMSIGMIELTSQDIQRRRPAAIQVMYGTPPLQCNQCGYRCPKSADAQKKMDAHLDWHFRQNRRMKDKAKKSHSRSWLVGEE
ncbi:hypothetical protein BX616_006939, partial [Lobosporangium transversale]